MGMRGRLEIVESKRRGRWFWRRRAPNGQIAGTSLPDTYSRAASALRGAKREYPGVTLPVRTMPRYGRPERAR